MNGSSLFNAIEMAPRDPILGITEAYNADTNPRKVNLGVGVYTDDNGKVPLLECVKRAEAQMTAAAAPRSYLPIDGLAAYDKQVQALVFGTDSDVVKQGRAITVQSLGGTGGLKIGADFLKRFNGGAEVWISDPSWENHRALFESAGFTVKTYPYYDPASHGVNFAGLLAALDSAPAGTVIVLHACCHNPSGVDLDDNQWGQVIEVIGRRQLVPFLDLAYQGFSRSIEEDGAVVRRFAATGRPLLVSNSFSKSFSLYGERIGAFNLVAESKEEAQRVLSQLKRVVRTNYSNPPTHGAQIVATVLATPELRALWEQELGGMRDRIKAMRQSFVSKLKAKLPNHDFSFVAHQSGMFSFSGLTQAQVARLKTEFSVYAVDSGRICVAALNTRNIDTVVDAIAHVLT
ncbi:MAG: aspartate/tyrosine/aromatic aminotransferase [Betaproteobacteria bacterium]|nr:aspartate/tyrosine/aromatic aminotransferase [Betaproteobacteria bacterium]MDE1981023.1 aspartate/tyrosine/aromatic aminotransferase [Betaproteobacteria bacterium]